VAGSIGGPILGFTIVRLLYWIDPSMAEILKDREDPSQTKEFLDWAVTMGIDPPRPEDLAKMKVTSVAGRWMEKMPEEVHLTMEGRDGEPVHYARTDIAERIERRCYSSAARYWVGGGEVSRELFALAELACGGTKPAVDWFNRYVPDLKATPIDFLNRGGDPQVLEKLLVWMAGTTNSPRS
ncbi:hypothetical protein QCN27_19835, partial [Cereibacter sp. SYSU M97828]|nr:hypothetical protein [Cereibacter flavus]